MNVLILDERSDGEEEPDAAAKRQRKLEAQAEAHEADLRKARVKLRERSLDRRVQLEQAEGALQVREMGVQVGE